MKSWVGLLGGLAVAASMVGAPGTASADGHSWGGVYIGANAGWAGRDYDWAFNPAIPGAVHQAYSLSQSGGIYGLHAGLQHQIGQFVIGVEGAFSGGRDKFARETNFGNTTTLDLFLYGDNPSAGGDTVDYYPDTAPQAGGGGGFFRYHR